MPLSYILCVHRIRWSIFSLGDNNVELPDIFTYLTHVFSLKNLSSQILCKQTRPFFWALLYALLLLVFWQTYHCKVQLRIYTVILLRKFCANLIFAISQIDEKGFIFFFFSKHSLKLKWQRSTEQSWDPVSRRWRRWRRRRRLRKPLTSRALNHDRGRRAAVLYPKYPLLYF